MSLLTDTMGTPERVWSVTRAVAAADGTLTRDDLAGLLNPNFQINGQERNPTDVAPKQAVGSTTSLGLIELVNGVYHLRTSAPSDYGEFSDQVHARLCAIGPDDPDFLVLEAYAWMSLEIDKRQSLGWCAQNAKTFATAVENDIGNSGAGELRINDTKVQPWRRWIQFLDLAVDLPGSLGFYPCVTGRLSRVLSQSGLQHSVEIPFSEFRAAVAQDMPYLDGGKLQELVATRTGQKAEGRKVSRLLSMALRDLKDAGQIELIVRGDAANTFELAADDRKARSVLSVVLKGAPT